MRHFGRFFLVALCLMAASSAAGAKKSKPGRGASIYHAGWIDFNKNGVMDRYEDPKLPVEERVADLIGQMTVEEKTCQLATLYGCGRVLRIEDALPQEAWKDSVWKDGIANIDEPLNGVGPAYDRWRDLIYPFSSHVEALHKIQKFFVEETRLGIPVEFTNEGIHGLNHTKATPLPAPIALGSTWNRELIRTAGEIAGHEAVLLGYHSVYAPILDLARDQRWGRTLECYSEDPFLIAELGVQMATGVQSQGVASCLKHYAAYSVPKGGRDGDCRTDPHITPRELHEIYMYPFKRVFMEAHPWEVMCSYNDWNGEPVAASHYFLTELLRETYGFDGYVVSDSDAVEYVYTKHKAAETYDDAVRQVIEAGLNVRTNFQQPAIYIHALRRLIAAGKISMDLVDERVRQVLTVKMREGLFDDPYTGNGKMADLMVGEDVHKSFVHDLGAEATVLLKNEGGLLPLSKDKVSKVLVTGPLADESNFMASRYGPNGLDAITMLRGLREYLGKDAVVYSKGCEIVDRHWPESEIIPYPLEEDEIAMMDAAVAAAEDVDVIVAVMGEDEHRTGEAKSRTSLELPGRQRELLMRLAKTGKPVVLVLINGQPLTINWENANIPAILETWFPTNVGGQIVAETLFGEINPSGKLPITFPKTVGQIEYNFPFKKGSHNRGEPTRVSGALYPFGYGLSYTTFEYSDMEVVPAGENFEVSCTITNSGDMDGEEVVQFYLRDKVSSIVTYDSVLRGFEKVSLAAGESKTVKFTVTPSDMSFLGKDMTWVVEPGEFDFMIGASSEDIRLSKTIRL